jgi:hypothetical protein
MEQAYLTVMSQIQNVMLVFPSYICALLRKCGDN